MAMDRDEQGDDLHVTIPLGGPIYVQDMVGPLTRVPDFESMVFVELQNLKSELSGDSTDTFNEEILVDELKIITEDELVAKAFEEAFKDGQLSEDASKALVEHLSPRSGDNNIAAGPNSVCPQHSESDSKAMVLYESSDTVPVGSCSNQKTNKHTLGKRKKRTCGNKNKNSFDESYMAKVEQLAKIKQNQEEQKASVRLHSFDGSSRGARCGAATKVERITSLKSASASTQVRASNTFDNVPVHFPESVLCFEIYHPRKALLKTQEFLVLGQQFLTEVKDKIYCSTDDLMKKDGKHNPSGYFLIEDVFFNDTRDPSAVDYSKPILDWLENSKDDALEKWEYVTSGVSHQKQKALLGSEKKQHLPRLKSTEMQTTRFRDIRFRVGAGYIYCHQGDCKHVIVIRNMRLINSEDVQNRAAYPLTTYQPKLRYRKCSVCKIYRAEKMTIDDKWAGSNPCYFCNVCYYMLHYGDGMLLYGDYRVYDCHHDLLGGFDK
ncbi:snRNA-activating protein complex subunit [Andrographis paniculata]|uniref:snRNA-activating protein complex subunit n=1 Tax=Andrographis paniculata TaxID=175694 RepID=UPI0021E84491|nr:snRNA-activating protein complex subunit [Andrographis paniculata]XP_051133987.1 snRNA-activating protein complex subunit [Andrographis paniculata]XP_051133988.1 snRNA-activating protein complex subunit [Andrographis paniculata]XP_051133989.1 snRNA-activating protein complex subunit [Andrographis paniculata]